MEFEHIIEPKGGSKISMDSSGKLIVPDNPIVPFIEGDGIGSDITPAMISVCLLYTSPSPRDRG